MNIIIYIAFLVHSLSAYGSENSTYTFTNKTLCQPTIGTLTVIEGSETNLSIIICYASVCNYTLSVADESILNIVQSKCNPLENGYFLNLTVKAKYIGITDLYLLKDNKMLVSGLQILVIRKRRYIDKLYNYILTALLILISFGFGCQLNLLVVFDYLRRPIAPLLAAFSQFVIMPSIGIILALSFGLDSTLALGLISVSCSPGGGASNSWAFLLGGDPDLSLTMTFISLTFALAMMPLWLFVATEYVIDLGQHVNVPYLIIASTLAMFVLPCFAGIVLARFFKDFAMKLANYTIKPLTMVFLFWVLVVGTYINLYMFRVMARYVFSVVPVAMLLPWTGMLVGYTLSRYLARQNNKVSITVAIETGIQNMGIPIVMLQGYFTQPYGDLAATVVQCVGMMTPIPLYLALIAIKINKRYQEYKDKQNYKATGNERDSKQVEQSDQLNTSCDEVISQPELLYP